MNEEPLPRLVRDKALVRLDNAFRDRIRLVEEAKTLTAWQKKVAIHHLTAMRTRARQIGQDARRKYGEVGS